MPFNHDRGQPASAPQDLPPIAPPAVEPDQAGVTFAQDKLHRNASVRDKLKKQDPGSLAQAEQLARAHALRTLNGLRVIAPALRQALEGALTAEQQAEQFTATMGRARSFANQGCAYMDLDATLDKNRWAVAMFERAFIAAFAEGKVPDSVGEALFRVALEQAGERGQESIVPDHKEDSTVIRQALIMGLSHVICEQARFNFFRPDPAADVEMLAQLLIDSAEQVLDAHVQPMTADLERQSMLSALIEEGGRLMAQAWKLEAIKAQVPTKSRSRDEMARWMKLNPTGLPLDHVMLSFRQQMARLSQLMKVPRTRR